MEPPLKKQRTDEGNEAPDPKVVLCFGDSNTHGKSSEEDARLPYNKRWTTYLQNGLGSNYHVISEGLNGRTTVADDAYNNPLLGGEGMNGRRYLAPCLYSHRPLDLVIIGLGTNDLQSRFCLTAFDIANGVKTLATDVKKSEAGPDGKPPKILILSPPLVTETACSREWGFNAEKSKSVIPAIYQMCLKESLPFVDLSEVARTGTDGVHFNAMESAKIGARMVEEVKRVLAHDE